MDVFELQRALTMGNINFSLKTVQALIRLYDRNRQGKIGYQVGWRGCSGVTLATLFSHARSAHPVPPLFAIVVMDQQEYERMHQFLANITAAFRRYDADRSGTLNRAEVKVALSAAGFQLDDPAFEKLFTSFDPDKCAEEGGGRRKEGLTVVVPTHAGGGGSFRFEIRPGHIDMADVVRR